MEKCNVLLADDHTILAEGTAALLSDYPFIDLVGIVTDGEQAMQVVKEQQPHILVSDISMPGMSIFEIADYIQEEKLATQILIFSMHDAPDYIYKALSSNVAGYLTKNADLDELVKAIEKVRAGEEYYSQTVSQIIVKGFKKRSEDSTHPQDPIDKLSKREKEVLKLLADGANSKEIAEELFLSERTVSNHRANMLQKCNVDNTVKLVRLYLDHEHKW